MLIIVDMSVEQGIKCDISLLNSIITLCSLSAFSRGRNSNKCNLMGCCCLCVACQTVVDHWYVSLYSEPTTAPWWLVPTAIGN